MTRLLVLGASHLRRGSEREPDESLNSIISRVIAWQPDAIAIEILPAELITTYLRLGGPYADLPFGGMKDAAACAEAASGLHDWTLWEARDVGRDESRSPRDRTIAWCAAYEPYTALLHSKTSQDLPPPVLRALDLVETHSGESWRVAGVVASHLGLQRLHPIDDHTDWATSEPTDADVQNLATSMTEHVQAHPLVASYEAQYAQALAGSDLWPLWRQLNSPEAVSSAEELESDYLLAHGAPPWLARKTLAGWRGRNLAMAAKVRAVLGDYPGGRVLALVGQSHKGPIEAALGVGQRDVEIASVAELDRPEVPPARPGC